MERKAMKQRAKNLMRENHGMYIVMALVPLLILGAAGGATLGLAAIFLAPVLVGQALFFIRSNETEASKTLQIELLFDGFKENRYLKNVAYLLLRDIFIFLWILLLIIPGIIKSLAYALVPYLLADKTVDLLDEDPITKSRKMMDGYKWELFVLHLSFIGWFILGALTLGILTILYVLPYYQQTMAIFYQKVKDNYDPKVKEGFPQY
ncbi:MAG: DUF975 family protein [Bacillota bacterium]